MIINPVITMFLLIQLEFSDGSTVMITGVLPRDRLVFWAARHAPRPIHRNCVCLAAPIRYRRYVVFAVAAAQRTPRVGTARLESLVACTKKKRHYVTGGHRGNVWFHGLGRSRSEESLDASTRPKPALLATRPEPMLVLIVFDLANVAVSIE